MEVVISYQKAAVEEAYQVIDTVECQIDKVVKVAYHTVEEEACYIVSFVTNHTIELEVTHTTDLEVNYTIDFVDNFTIK